MGSATSSAQMLIEAAAFPAPNPPSYDHEHKNLFFVSTRNSRKVECMKYEYDEHKDENKNERTVILYSHGNASDIGHMDNFLSGLAKDVKVDIVSYDYEGYGLTGGKPSEAGCIRS